jgi:hypothetical protein
VAFREWKQGLQMKMIFPPKMQASFALEIALPASDEKSMI